MPTHKFQIGQTVFLTPSNRHIPEGAYIVTKKLPDRDGEFEYRVKSATAGYNATIFLRMLGDQGGLVTAKYLINSVKPSDGYTALYERGRLDLTVEAMVVENPKWHSLFTSQELEKARLRLTQYGYKPKDNV
jgi:hypothetical protein